jgi:sugar phosphate isomerase/epimerase
MKTRTGGFEIGFRRGWSEWQKDLDNVIDWALDNDLNVIDVGGDADQIAGQITTAGLKIGSADFKNIHSLISSDPGKRRETVELNKPYIQACAKQGIRNFFTVMLPEDPSKSRAENFGYMVAGLEELVPILESENSFLVIEGWPGPGSLVCNPEGYRALFQQVPSASMAINFDPSHLIRMGIEGIKFLNEFADRVKHAHGKDTQVYPEAFYEYGNELPPIFGKPHDFGAMSWRYTIPSAGVFRWQKGLEILREAGYKGAISIELEDENFNGTEEGEKKGILTGAQFLAGL